MEAIKVLHIVGGGEFGGAERSILDLLRFLPPPYEPMVACFYQGRFQEVMRQNGIPCLFIPNRGRYDWRSTRVLRSIVRQHRLDLLHTHGVRANFFGRLAGRLERLPVVTTVHSNLSRDYPEWTGRLLAWGMESTTRPLSRHFIAVSSGIKQELLRAGIPEGKISVIRNGVDPAYWKKDPEARRRLRRELGLPEDVPVVGMVARLHPVKGHAVFFRAAARIVAQGRPVHFVSIGEGHWRGKLDRLARALLPPGSHTFLGFRADVRSWASGLDVHVTASLAEGLGLSVLEAMSLEVPVVASRVGGVPDIIEHGQNGLMFEAGNDRALADAVLRLLRDPDYARMLALAGRKTVEEKFRLEHTAERTALCYREILAKR